MLLSKGEFITIDDFMCDTDAPVVVVDNSAKGIKEMEKDLILKTLKDVNGNKTKAAKILGVSVRTIRNKLNEYGKFFPDP
ncbi:Fis family transcriptional regulator [Candidatus Magnetobacterium bavaricum]|uniref:Fis family transcriptional regulator n=1 Tax=Candidatus Magnetobacterium bavaricum TaxID=29290 RepID=A0A0F3H1T9_9BACT|nr:Fis family transcriptional regulator [Candidatus Magnetobacterium bavaricum]